MSSIIFIIIIIAIVVAGIFLYRRRRRPQTLDKIYFMKKWKELQKLCADKSTWSQAIISADSLLDEALKKKRLGGKSMGERLVKAQRVLTDNDGVWFGHKLHNKIDAEPKFNVKEGDVKTALLGIRQALKDLGALPSDQPRNS